MPVTLEEYDKALHETPVVAVQMAQRLLDVVRRDICSGKLSRDEVRAHLEALYDIYEERGQENELEAVADVLDSFNGWSPLRAAL
jgi:hypothetical protein